MNVQEDFEFLLKNLTESNYGDEEQKESTNRIRKALVNVINSFITDTTDKVSYKMQPLLGMIELYIQKWKTLFVNDATACFKVNTEKEFTNLVISRMLKILSNTDLQSLYYPACKIVVAILEIYSKENAFEFLNLVNEFVLVLEDLIEFDKEFFDWQKLETKVLNRFTLSLSNCPSFDADERTSTTTTLGSGGGDAATRPCESIDFLTSKPKYILIETPAHCSMLQTNITFILNEICLQLINVTSQDLYEKLWSVLCEQLEYGDKLLKIITYKLVLSLIEIRVLPSNRFDFSTETLVYFIDCLLGTLELLLTENSDLLVKGDNQDDAAKIHLNEANQSQELDRLVSCLISKIFTGDASQLIGSGSVSCASSSSSSSAAAAGAGCNLSAIAGVSAGGGGGVGVGHPAANGLDINYMLVQLIGVFKAADLNRASEQLVNALFSMIFNLVRLKMHSNQFKYLDLCILNDMSEALINQLGRCDFNNTYLNLTVAQGLVYEIEMNLENRLANRDTVSVLDKSNPKLEMFKYDLKMETIQTKLYKKLISKAKEFLNTNKVIATNSQEFKLKSNGFNSVLEILSYACIMLQTDPMLIEEYRNPLIESARNFLFVQSPMNTNNSSGGGANSIQQQMLQQSGLSDSGDSIYLPLLLYWITILNDAKHAAYIHIPYMHALRTFKCVFLSSVEWKKNISQNLIAFYSLPWLAAETNSYDLELFRDKGFKQCSLSLIQSSQSHGVLAKLKCYCVQYLCLIPKNLCSQWRTHIIGKCVRDDSDEQVRICALKYLPYLIYHLGVSSNVIVFQLVQPSLKEEKSLSVLKAYGLLLRHICCLISRKCLVLRKLVFTQSPPASVVTSTPGAADDDDDAMAIDSAVAADANVNASERLTLVDDMNDHFEIVCTCCDKSRTELAILPGLAKRKNVDLVRMLCNRPKFIDTQILVQFMHALGGASQLVGQAAAAAAATTSGGSNDLQISSMKSLLVRNLDRAFNHLEFGSLLHQPTLVSDHLIDPLVQMSNNLTGAKSTAAGASGSSANSNLTFVYKEALNLFSDTSLDPLVRFDFARFMIPKLICPNGVAASSAHFPSSLGSTSSSKMDYDAGDDLLGAMHNSLCTSIYSVANQSDTQLDHNCNLERQLCEGFVRAKASKSILEIFVYVLSLGRLALSLKKCDEYMLLCVKHLLEIFDDPHDDAELASLASALAQRQLFVLSKRVNMQELLTEFEEKICEIVADAIFNSVQRHYQHFVVAAAATANQSAASGEQATATPAPTFYLNRVNTSLKDILRVFNVTDSCGFVRSYQRYLVSFLTSRATANDTNHKVITKSLEFLSKKINVHLSKLIEDNFPHIFTQSNLHSPEIANVFQYITDEIHLDIDRLINFNKQRLLNELLSRCGNLNYRAKVWQAVYCLTAVNSEEAIASANRKFDESRIVKAIEPVLLATLIHFDMCLMKSAINLKEKCQVLESLNVLIAILGARIITQVRYKIMTTLKLAMQQCSKFSELNCKLWDTFLRTVDKQALGPILNQISVYLLQLLALQPYKVSKIFEYLIVQNKEHLQAYFNELYFIPEHSCLQQVNSILKKYTDAKYILELTTTTAFAPVSALADTNSAASQKVLVYLIKHYLKGALHENADLRVKALEKLYALLKEKCTQIIYLIQRQENSQIVSEIILALMNGCRDSDPRAKLLFGSCLGEIGAIDPANVSLANTSASAAVSASGAAGSQQQTPASVQSNASLNKSNKTPITPATASGAGSSTPATSASTTPLLNPNDLLMNPSLLSEESFSDSFSHSLIMELSKAYLAARNTHEQDSASYAIQESLKIYGCSAVDPKNPSSTKAIQNVKLWSTFPDSFKEILVPLRTSKYEIQSFDNVGSFKTPIILYECKTYEEWVFKWCAYLISKIGNSSSSSSSGSDAAGQQQADKELKVFPKLQFIIRFNLNVALFILPYLIIKIIMQNWSSEITDQMYEEIMSVIQLNQLTLPSSSSSSCSAIASSSNATLSVAAIAGQSAQLASAGTMNNTEASTSVADMTSLQSGTGAGGGTNHYSHKIMLNNHHICCQTIFNIYDHLMRQVNFYRTKMTEIQMSMNARQKASMAANRNNPAGAKDKQTPNEILLCKYRDLFDLYYKFIQRVPQQTLSRAAFECKAYCRSLMHYELHMRNTPGAFSIQNSTINIAQEHLIELQNLYASMDEIDAASGILVLKKGSEESLADAAFRHKINGRLNESIACIEQMLESDESAKHDLKQHENYVRTFISVGRHRNALSYLEGLMVDRAEWRDALETYRIEACWKLGNWDKLKQIVSSTTPASAAAATAGSSAGDDEENETTTRTGHNVVSSAFLGLNSNSKVELVYDLVERKNNIANSFNSGIGKLFTFVADRAEKEFYETLCVLREQQIGPLSAVSMEAGGSSYQRGYEYVVNLQALQEIESCLSELFKLPTHNSTEIEQYKNLLNKNLDSYLIEPWENRVQTMQPSFKHLEPIYNVRIGLLNFLASHLNINVAKPLAKLWIRLAKIARKAGMFENAYQYMLNAQGQIKPADSNNLEELLVEKSKWYWQREDKDSALFYLQKGLNELFNNNEASVETDASNSELYSKVLLMYTKYSEENGSLDSETIRRNYMKVQKICSKTEQAHFQMAQFTDRLGTSVSENTGKKEKFWEYILEICSYYGTSLEYGCQNIYQSLPRMMSIWLDFGADYFDHFCRGTDGGGGSASSAALAAANNSRSSTMNKNLTQLNSILNKLNQIVSNALQRIPTFAFLTVYPQLVSRICHPEERVFETLSNILMKVLFLYPSQAIWMLIAVKNSSVEFRKNRCKIIMDKAIRQQPDLRKFIMDSSELAEKIVQLGNLNVENGVTQLSLSSTFKPLKRLVESRDFSRLLIPSQFQVTLQLPSSESSANSSGSSSAFYSANSFSNMTTTGGGGASTTNAPQNVSSSLSNQSFRSHNPYPLELVYISCFEDNVLVMNSLQKPKKVTIRGTDGKLYAFLCKAKDDLRIDYRIMEFFSVINKFLKQEPESRRRNLYIRTYAVTPLNENSGIIEWIEDLYTLRSILIKFYAERGVGSVTSSEWKVHEEKISKDKEHALKVYKLFLDRYKPTVLYEWFLRTFSEPNSWYNARSNYVRTAAVMSVCGYVVGLGDRHCENILMASSNGDCIHVDFNCLFNKGETLGVPEIVPFRLTHNMIEAMGPLGFEGIYRKTCEVTLKIMRDYREPLITILKTFIYDPLVEWKAPNNAKTYESGETVSAKGQLHLQNITSRLKGMHTKHWILANSSRVKALPLSVEGHVNSLIKEATDDKNLSQMYIGWSSFF